MMLSFLCIKDVTAAHDKKKKFFTKGRMYRKVEDHYYRSEEKSIVVRDDHNDYHRIHSSGSGSNFFFEHFAA